MPAPNKAPSPAQPSSCDKNGLASLRALPKDEMRNYVLQQVLAVNPRLASGASVAELQSQLVTSARQSAAPATAADHRVAKVLLAMLEEFEQELEQRELDQQLANLEIRRQEAYAEHKRVLAEFFGAVEPAGLGAEARAALTSQAAYLRALGCEVSDVVRAARLLAEERAGAGLREGPTSARPPA